MSGRSLLHSALMANEVVKKAKRRRKSCMIFKVDYEKVYVFVNWNILFYMLGRLGFNSKWIIWVKECLESNFVSILVNRSPTKEFKILKELRQRDPIAVFLFNVVMKGWVVS